MTREEASFILANIDRRVCDDELNEALDMAIKALEQEPCEDAISRQSALDLATTIETDDFSGNEILNVVEVDDIKKLPSVTPTSKAGQWIGGEIGHCSVCGHKGCASDIWSGCGDDVFCPNCGAKMD